MTNFTIIYTTETGKCYPAAIEQNGKYCSVITTTDKRNAMQFATSAEANSWNEFFNNVTPHTQIIPINK